MVLKLTMASDLIFAFLSSKRYIVVYIIIGFFSLIIQFIVNYVLYNFFDSELFYIGVACSILSAFYLNVKYNFYVKKHLLFKSLIIFFLVSNVSYLIQENLMELINVPYFQSMFLVSGLTFWFFYLLHKAFSFKNKTHIGLALHLNKNEKIEDIYKQIRNFPDFIHIDLISEDYNSKNTSIDINLISKIENLWPNKSKQVHLMTDKPFEYIKKINNTKYSYFIDLNCIQEYKRNIDDLTKFNIGFTILMNSSKKEIDGALQLDKELMILCVDEPGISGQMFSEKAYDLIKYVEKNKTNAKVTIDGGVNLDIIKNTSFNKYVSASNILTSLHPAGKIFELRYAKNYEQ